MSDFKAKMHQNRFWLRLTALSQTGFKGPTSKERGRKRTGGDGIARGGKGRGEQGRGQVLTHVSIPILACLSIVHTMHLIVR